LKDTHQKQDDQRDTEYKQLKQEKELEISSLKGKHTEHKVKYMI